MGQVLKFDAAKGHYPSPLLTKNEQVKLLADGIDWEKETFVGELTAINLEGGSIECDGLRFDMDFFSGKNSEDIVAREIGGTVRRSLESELSEKGLHFREYDPVEIVCAKLFKVSPRHSVYICLVRVFLDNGKCIYSYFYLMRKRRAVEVDGWGTVNEFGDFFLINPYATWNMASLVTKQRNGMFFDPEDKQTEKSMIEVFDKTEEHRQKERAEKYRGRKTAL